MHVRIFQSSKTAMQSGQAKSGQWVLQPKTTGQNLQKVAESVMGWIAGPSTEGQIQLAFDTQAQAVEYAKTKGWSFEVHPSQARTVRPKSYANNFPTNPVA